MKRNKDIIELMPKIKVSLKIVPFGSVSYEITGSAERPLIEKKPDMPRYIVPLTTNIEEVGIHYEEGGIYSVPKITSGM